MSHLRIAGSHDSPDRDQQQSVLSTQSQSQKLNNKMERFGPNLCSVLIELIKEMADFCLSKKVELSQISAFSDKNDDWPRALLSIYESIYTVDC
jgi:hypothetical protein